MVDTLVHDKAFQSLSLCYVSIYFVLWVLPHCPYFPLITIICASIPLLSANIILRLPPLSAKSADYTSIPYIIMVLQHYCICLLQNFYIKGSTRRMKSMITLYGRSLISQAMTKNQAANTLDTIIRQHNPREVVTHIDTIGIGWP